MLQHHSLAVPKGERVDNFWPLHFLGEPNAFE